MEHDELTISIMNVLMMCYTVIVMALEITGDSFQICKCISHCHWLMSF